MIRLINDDCLQAMDNLISEGLQIDAIITDPPYGMDFQSNRRFEKYNKIENDNNLYWLPEFAEKCYKITKNNTAHYVFCSFHYIDLFKQAFEKYFDIKNILIWQKNNHSMGDLNNNFASITEFILFFQKGQRSINGNRDSNILRFSKTNNINHPMEKPVSLMEYLIYKFSDKEDLICDPFMGSGTTGVACKNLFRNFIGIEKDKKYFEIAKKRINNTNTLFYQEAL